MKLQKLFKLYLKDLIKNKKVNQEQITLTVSKLAGSNAVFVANDVKAKLEYYKKRLDKLVWAIHAKGFS